MRVRQPAVAREALGSRVVATIGVEAGLDAAGSHRTETLAELPHAGLADLTLEPAPGTRAFGLELRVDEDRRHGYSISPHSAKLPR